MVTVASLSSGMVVSGWDGVVNSGPRISSGEGNGGRGSASGNGSKLGEVPSSGRVWARVKGVVWVVVCWIDRGSAALAGRAESRMVNGSSREMAQGACDGLEVDGIERMNRELVSWGLRRRLDFVVIL